SSLVLAVVEEHGLLAVGADELAPLVAVAHGHGETDLGGDGGCAVERDAALDERSEHGEEAAARALDGRRVRAVGRDAAVPAEEVAPGDAHVREVEASVVDAVEATLEPVVLAAHAGEEVARGAVGALLAD